MQKGKLSNIDIQRRVRITISIVLFLSLCAWFSISVINIDDSDITDIVNSIKEDPVTFDILKRKNVALKNRNEDYNKKEFVDYDLLKVEEEIQQIREHIQTPLTKSKVVPNGLEVTSSPENLKCSSVAECQFKDILSSSPVILFVTSSESESFHLLNILTSEFEIYPEMWIIDLDKMKDDGKLLNHLKDTITSQMDSIPFLFINGTPVLTKNDLNEDIKENEKQSQLSDKLQSLANGNVIITKKSAPSNI